MKPTERHVHSVVEAGAALTQDPAAVAALWDEVEALEGRYEDARKANDRPTLRAIGDQLGPKRQHLKQALLQTGWRSGAAARAEG